MKLGIVIIIYLLAGVVIMENQFMHYLLILLLLAGITLTISLVARLFRFYSTVSWANRVMKRLGTVVIIACLAWATFKPLMGIIFK